MTQALGAGGVGILAVLGVLAANVLRDRGVAPDAVRRIAAVFGGGAYLIAVLSLDAWTAVAASGALGLLVLVLRLRCREHLRGLAGGASRQRWAEVVYPLAGAASLAVGWGILGDRWLAFVPIAFMAWGDNVAGAVRARIQPSRRDASPWPSAAMLLVCLVTAGLYQPYWVGAIGAVAATVGERLRPTDHPLWDDNWVVVAAALLVMGTVSTAHL